MTQAVTFHFTSPQFIFESGSVTFSKGARLSTSPDNNVGTILNGALDDALVEGPIDFDASTSRCCLSSVETSSGERVPRYAVMAAIGEHSRGRASATFEVAPEEQGERLIVLQAN